MNRRQYELAKYLWSKGKKANDIALACHVTYSEVMNTAYAHRTDFPQRYRRVTPGMKQLMKSLRDEGMSYQRIAEATGYSVQTVGRHLSGYEVEYE